MNSKTSLRYSLILLALLVFTPLSSEELPKSPPFLLVTIPKSGTHMILKCLRLLQNRVEKEIRITLEIPEWNFQDPAEMREELDGKIDALMSDDCYLLSHSDFSSAIVRVLKRYPKLPLLLGVRDLRDALISEVFYQGPLIESIIGPSTVKEKLIFLIENGNNLNLHINLLSVFHHAKAIVKLLDHPNALVVRFEELVGNKGGGDDGFQKRTIRKIAKTIGVPLPVERLEFIQSILFGNAGMPSRTFDSGQIGSWQLHFDKHVNDLFNKKYGELHKRLGYITYSSKDL